MAKSEGQKPLGRRRRKWETNVEIDLKLKRWDGVDLIGQFQGREKKRSVVKAVKNISFPEVPKIFCLRNEHLDCLKYFAKIVDPLKGWKSSNIWGTNLKNRKFYSGRY